MTTADYVIVGGGTAGCIVAARLSEDPDVTVTVLEPGPSDADEPPRALDIRRWAEMLEGEYDLDYRSVTQVRGNSNIRQARMRILGGCSTANTMITWRPLPADLDEWVGLGAKGWDASTVHPYYDRLATPPSPPRWRRRTKTPTSPTWSSRRGGPWPCPPGPNGTVTPTSLKQAGGAQASSRSVTPPGTHLRSSTSVHYLHEAIRTRDNLAVRHGMHANRVLVEGGSAVGVLATDGDGIEHRFDAAREVIVCCGAIDTPPKLLQLSGIGPRKVLSDAGVDVVVDSPPGVGENLMDHAEGLIVWQAVREVPETCATGWDAGARCAFTTTGQRGRTS